ncbi:zinc finger CCCH domain-containing protein 3 [Rhea pennata]|uniref:zinc finger CCCH domain-containing protein 3 n=1 Tax=Rhea pennata TaxID=8795 RepID=UPI002E261E42
MEEREQLRRQIRLLQGLINDHKNVHGNAPVPLPSAMQRWRNPRQLTFSRRGAFSSSYSQQTPRDFQPRQGNSWRKKYSLVNRPACHADSSGSASTSQAFVSQGGDQAPGPQGAAPERHVDLTTDGNIVVGIQLPQRPGPVVKAKSFAEVSSCREVSGLKKVVAVTDSGKNLQECSNSLYTSQNDERKPSFSVSFNSSYQSASSVHLKVSGLLRTVHVSDEAARSTAAARRTASENAVTLKSEPQQPSAVPDRQLGCHSAWKKPEPPNPGQSSSEQVTDALGEPKLLRNTETRLRPAQAATSAVGMNPMKSRFSVFSKVTSLQRAASTSVSSKALKFRKTNYTWVANPGKCSRTVKRWISPRTSDSARKLAGGADRVAKLSPKGDLGAKLKKSGLQSKLGVSPSKYKWKASSLQTSPSTSKSAFRWQSEDQKKAGISGVSRASSVPLPLNDASVSHSGVQSSFSETVFSGYKVKSRTKIIKRKGSSGSPADKKSSSSPITPLKCHFHLRKRNSLRGKTSATLKRSSPKGLVQITKHRLCRLPATRMQVSGKEGASLHFIRTPPSSKVIKTRYRIVKKNVVSSMGSLSSFNSPIPTWKTRRLAASRSPGLNQTRPSPPSSKSQQMQQRWRSKGLRCIGGVMYRVSANKLSKTSSTPGRTRDQSTKSPGRAARLTSTPSSPGYSPSSCLNRSATSRYIASRAVQRSLAIIRQAKQKKEKKKEYCMYYNRFGKCNRGESCPYIHDPEKVAVCTRFLRGTCKKTDGTCSFSHQVSKDKMPVCSYFLKGICSNSNCPYSHVYVSRKAEVCQDFLKGYCPMGEKCKKKHTLVCPDFAKKGVCPKGAQCKLRHPQKKRRPRQPGAAGDADRGHPPSKWRRLCEETGRDDAVQLHDDGAMPGPSGTEREATFWSDTDPSRSSRLQKLPSFISLQSPTSPEDRPCKAEPSEDEPAEEPGPAKWKRAFAASGGSENATRQEGGGKEGKRLQIKPRL